MRWCKNYIKVEKNKHEKKTFIHLLFHSVYYNNQNENKISIQWSNFRSANILGFKFLKGGQKNMWENNDWKFSVYETMTIPHS